MIIYFFISYQKLNRKNIFLFFIRINLHFFLRAPPRIDYLQQLIPIIVQLGGTGILLGK